MDTWSNSTQAETLCTFLTRLHSFRCVHAGFYKGRIAKAIIAALDEEKGVMTLDDLEQHCSTVTRPIHTTYRGHTIYEVPPPTQARPLHRRTQMILILVSSSVIHLALPQEVTTSLGCHSCSCGGSDPINNPNDTARSNQPIGVVVVSLSGISMTT